MILSSRPKQGQTFGTMKTNDQWFEPGDKVMQVMSTAELGRPTSGRGGSLRGKVLCVLQCWANWRGYNVVAFVGIPDDGRGRYAACFRRVEEIRLCVRAAERMGEPVTQEEAAP